MSISCIWIWTEEENKILQNNYPQYTRKEIQKLLPQREWGSITAQAYHLGLHLDKKKFGPGYRWSQHKTLDIIDTILGEVSLRDRKYAWMKSPKGYPLEIDGYYPSNNLAIEFQGQHHYGKNYLGHRDFKYQQTCDKIKRETTKSRGILFLEIKYDEPLTKEHLESRLTGSGLCLRS